MNNISKTDIVKEFIFKQIKEGKIKKNMRLPSCREVASKLSLNKITVNRAYNELEREHKVYSIPRGGFYLVDSENNSSRQNTKIDFATVKPDSKLIPYREFAHSINNAIEEYKSTLLDYESTIGLLSFRESLKSEFESKGVYTTSDRIIATHGAQQSISLVFQAIFKNNKGKLLVEVPTYSIALNLASYLEVDVVGIERKEDGFDFKKIEMLFKKGDIAAFYVIPRHHNPTGYSLTENNKKKIAELCNKYNIIVIEDDYLADLGYKKGSMPIHYYDITKSTVYIKSFSKTFMPGLRLGVAVLPQKLAESVVNLKYISDLNTSKLTQAALDIFIKSGMYEKHVKKVKKSYEAKLRRAKEIIDTLSPNNLLWHVPENGIFIWAKLPKYIDINLLKNNLKNRGILINSTEEYFLKEEWEKRDFNYLRLCISSVPEEDISSITDIISEIRALMEAHGEGDVT